MIERPNDPDADQTARIMDSTRKMIDEANARRIAAQREFELPISRKGLRKRNRKTSVFHRSIR
jgi:hypothetical protein